MGLLISFRKNIFGIPIHISTLEFPEHHESTINYSEQVSFGFHRLNLFTEYIAKNPIGILPLNAEPRN